MEGYNLKCYFLCVSYRQTCSDVQKSKFGLSGLCGSFQTFEDGIIMSTFQGTQRHFTEVAMKSLKKKKNKKKAETFKDVCP